MNINGVMCDKQIGGKSGRCIFSKLKDGLSRKWWRKKDKEKAHIGGSFIPFVWREELSGNWKGFEKIAISVIGSRAILLN